MSEEIDYRSERADAMREMHYPDNEYTLMIGADALEKIGKACVRVTYTLKPSELVRIALRRYAKLKPDLSEIDPGSTTGGQPRTFQLHNLPRYDEEMFRRILAWFLDTQVEYVVPPQLTNEEQTILSTAKIKYDA